jgi:DNA-binding MarR family transcriptional regulator
MSILDRFHRNRGAGLPKNATFRLTQEGREKLQTYTGTPQARILVAMETQGSSADVDEIAGSSGLSRGQVERGILALIQKGYVQRSGGGYTTTTTEGMEE